jgi:hypothetical protein
MVIGGFIAFWFTRKRCAFGDDLETSTATATT